MRTGRTLTTDDAAAIALSGLAYLAAEPALVDRFLAITGLTPERLRAEADTADLQCAVLDHLMNDESLLLAFAANAGIDAALIRAAYAVLAERQAC